MFFGKSGVSFRQTGQSWEVFVSTSVEDQEAVMGRLPSLPGLAAGSTASTQAYNGQSGHHEVSEKASGDGSQSKVGPSSPQSPPSQTVHMSTLWARCPPPLTEWHIGSHGFIEITLIGRTDAPRQGG